MYLVTKEVVHRFPSHSYQFPGEIYGTGTSVGILENNCKGDLINPYKRFSMFLLYRSLLFVNFIYVSYFESRFRVDEFIKGKEMEVGFLCHMVTHPLERIPSRIHQINQTKYP